MNRRLSDKRKRFYGWALIVLAAAVVLLALNAAHAADFGITPMKLELEPGQRHGDVRVHNFSDQPLRMQITGHGCADAEDKDCTAPAKDLVFFPKALEVAPKQSRIVRIGVRGLSPTERRFALRLQEIRLVEPKAEEGKVQVQLLLNVQVGVIVRGAK